jgi:hypothetical protein
MTGSAAADSSSTTASDCGEVVPVGNRSSSERYELTVESESALRRDDRLGQDGNAHDALIVEKEDLRGARSDKGSLGDGGGGGGGREDGEGEDKVLLLKL